MVSGRKIRFIEPHGRRGRPFNAWIAQWPLLGPITLASILEKKGYDVQVYNENISGPAQENPEAWEDICSADVVGISIMTSTARRGYELAGLIKKDSGARVAMGGVHATFRSEEAIRYADVVVRGEGESVIEALARGEIREGIIQAAPLEDLDEIPALNYPLMRDFDRLVASSRRREFYKLPVMVSRGCPYGCTYCSVTRMFGRKVRRQSLEKVCSDMESYCDQGFRQFFFYDDNFTADRAWTRELLDRMRPLSIGFNAQVRVDFPWCDSRRSRADLELLRSMKRAGGDVLYIGYETVDQATASDWKKGYTGAGDLQERLLADTKMLHDHGFWIHGMFVLGPQHTRTSAEEIVRFARRAKLETLQISLLTPMPGTRLFEQMEEDLIFCDYPDDWDFYDGTHCVCGNTALEFEELQNLLLESHLQFYRWGGMSLRRLRAFLAERTGPVEKLLRLWENARTARKTLKAWRRETREFLQIAGQKLGETAKGSSV